MRKRSGMSLTWPVYAGAVLGNRFTGGVVVYDGEMCTRFGDRLYAVPIRLLWETPVESG